MKLAGTPYFPDFSGSLLFLEALNISMEACDCYFQQLRQAGVFDQINGAVVGYIDGLQNDEKAFMQMEEVLLRVSEDYNFPILKMNDFGHNCPNTVLPVGAMARLDADQCSLQILKPCVR
jgi:muramoyltetrapeptide carboxypeptidase